MNLSENLKKIRKENNLSQEQLAEKLSVSRQSVSKWESGQAYPEMDKVLQLCKLFNVSVDDLLNQDVSELNNNKTAKTNINKFIEDFLNCITKVIDLFSNLTFKEKIKCILEQVLLILMFYLTSKIILSIFQPLVTHIFSFLPERAYIFVFHIIEDIATICLCILSIAVISHIFKVRYLNYYVIVDRNHMLSDEDNKDDKETKADNNTSEISEISRKQKIIIRDPKHTMYNFISCILKCVIFLIKLIMTLVGLFVCIAFVFFVSCLGQDTQEALARCSDLAAKVEFKEAFMPCRLLPTKALQQERFDLYLSLFPLLESTYAQEGITLNKKDAGLESLRYFTPDDFPALM